MPTAPREYGCGLETIEEKFRPRPWPSGRAPLAGLGTPILSTYKLGQFTEPEGKSLAFSPPNALKPTTLTD
jgi:hypothetical protein